MRKKVIEQVLEKLSILNKISTEYVDVWNKASNSKFIPARSYFINHCYGGKMILRGDNGITTDNVTGVITPERMLCRITEIITSRKVYIKNYQKEIHSHAS